MGQPPVGEEHDRKEERVLERVERHRSVSGVLPLVGGWRVEVACVAVALVPHTPSFRRHNTAHGGTPLTAGARTLLAFTERRPYGPDCADSVKSTTEGVDTGRGLGRTDWGRKIGASVAAKAGG
jgi:hypothetical protein